MLVDDHPVWRQSLRKLLERGQVGRVVAEAADGEEAIRLASEAKPEVVVMDIGLPGLNGIEATKELLEVVPEARVLVLSASEQRADVVEAMRAGASGYLLKAASPEELVEGVRRVHRGEAVLPPALADMVLNELRGRGPRNPLDELTPREREVLGLMAEGKSNQAIREQLFLSAKSVESHVRNIFTKLGLEPAPDDHRRVLAVLTYLRSG